MTRFEYKTISYQIWYKYEIPFWTPKKYTKRNRDQINPQNTTRKYNVHFQVISNWSCFLYNQNQTRLLPNPISMTIE